MAYLSRLPRFEYLAPRSAAEACDLLALRAGEAKLLAGGTDLILQMRRRDVSPACVIGLKGIDELSFVRERPDGGVMIGAMTTMHMLLTSPLISENYAMLRQAAAGMGSPEIRHLATLGGNLAGALPCADFPPAFITLGAKVKLRKQQSERWVPVEDFFPGFGQTAAQPDELLTEIELPALPASSGGVYLKFHDRHAMDMTTTGVAAFVVWDPQRRVFQDVRIALASSAPIPLRIRKTEAALRGLAMDDVALNEAAALACEEADPRSSWRASRNFRMELLRTLIGRAIRGAWRLAAAPAEGGAS